jgi:capping protein (actin filament) muscle Z-line, beta
VANELFSVYREQYYEGGLSSVYLWETSAASTSAEAAPGAAAALSPQTAFAGAFLVHKGEGSGRHGASLSAGLWDAVHVVEVLPGEGGSTSYNLSTTIALHLATNTGESGGAKPGGRFELAGSLGRASSSVAPTPGAATGHLLVLGRLVEEMENKLRGTLDSVYFGQTRSVVGHLRASDGEMSGERRASMQASIMADVLKSSSLGRPPGGPMGLPGGFDPRAALAGLKKTAKPAAAPEQ